MLINFRRVSEFEEIAVGNYQEYESNAMYMFLSKVSHPPINVVVSRSYWEIYHWNL